VKPSGSYPVRLVLLLCCLAACTKAGDSPVPPMPEAPAGKSELRLVTLSPHLAELVWSVGAGDMLVGVSAYTDYPVMFASLPVVGDAFALDQERLALLRPNLLLAWESGTPRHVVDELVQRGYRVETVRTASVADVGAALRKIGSLTGYDESADEVAFAFEREMSNLAKSYSGAESVRVFYQVSQRPLYTVNGSHYVSDLIETCGGRNVFAGLSDLAPMISVEAVLERDPEALLASEDAGPAVFSDWDRWPQLAANTYANRFIMPADEIGRATPRLLIAAKAMCGALERARQNRRANLE
jgi:iron complex transport system substrate-binding protein